MIFKKPDNFQADDVFYLIGKIAFIPVLLFGFWFAFKGFGDYGSLLECEIRRISGLPCPGCGGTRAFYHLFRGEILESFRLNPAVIYGAAAYLHFMWTMSVRKHAGGRTERKVIIQYYLYGAAAVLLLQWLIKIVRIVCHFW